MLLHCLVISSPFGGIAVNDQTKCVEVKLCCSFLSGHVSSFVSLLQGEKEVGSLTFVPIYWLLLCDSSCRHFSSAQFLFSDCNHGIKTKLLSESLHPVCYYCNYRYIRISLTVLKCQARFVTEQLTFQLWTVLLVWIVSYFFKLCNIKYESI